MARIIRGLNSLDYELIKVLSGAHPDYVPKPKFCFTELVLTSDFC